MCPVDARVQTPTLTARRLEQSRSHRILWLLEELQLQYELKTFKRRADKLAPTELKKVHPLGKSPIITIEAPGSSKPMVLAESGAIVEYLCDHFGKARPTLVPERYQPGREGLVGGEREEWIRYRYFMHYVEGSLMPFLVMSLVNDSEYTRQSERHPVFAEQLSLTFLQPYAIRLHSLSAQSPALWPRRLRRPF